MNDDTRHESIQPVGYILCKKDNGIILKNPIMKDLGDSISSLNESMSFNNKQLSLSNIYVTGDLALLVLLLEKNIHLLNGVLNASQLQSIGNFLFIQWVMNGQLKI